MKVEFTDLAEDKSDLAAGITGYVPASLVLTRCSLGNPGVDHGPLICVTFGGRKILLRTDHAIALAHTLLGLAEAIQKEQS